MLEQAAQKLVLFRSDMTITDARAVIVASTICWMLGTNYQPHENYQGDITLVLSERSTLIPGLEPDVGLAEVRITLHISCMHTGIRKLKNMPCELAIV